MHVTSIKQQISQGIVVGPDLQRNSGKVGYQTLEGSILVQFQIVLQEIDHHPIPRRPPDTLNIILLIQITASSFLLQAITYPAPICLKPELSFLVTGCRRQGTFVLQHRTA